MKENKEWTVKIRMPYVDCPYRISTHSTLGTGPECSINNFYPCSYDNCNLKFEDKEDEM